MTLLSNRAVNFDATWAELEQHLLPMISDIRNGLSNNTWMNLYTGVYKVCANPTDPKPEQLYFKLKDLLERYCRGVLEELVAASTDTSMLVLYRDSFRNYSTGMRYGSEIFSYLNRYWIRTAHCENGQAPIAGVYPVQELAIHVWREIVFEEVKDRLRCGLVCLVTKTRELGATDFEESQLIMHVVDSCIKLGLNRYDPMKLYREEVEDELVRSTRFFYSRKAADLLQHQSVSEYMSSVKTILQQEEARCTGCFPNCTVYRMKDECHSVLIAQHVDRLCADAKTFFASAHEDLHALFQLLRLVDENVGLAKLKQLIRTFVENEGIQAVKKFTAEEAARRPEEFVTTLLQVQGRYHTMIRETFELHPLFRTAFDQACRAFVNFHQRTPELLALYSHSLLDKSGGCPMTPCGTPKASRLLLEETEIEGRLDGVGVVFRFIDDKDVFKHFYSKFLARRLINETLISEDLEAQMLRCLRETCGFEYISKLHRMFGDRSVSIDLSEQFNKSIAPKSADSTSSASSFSISGRARKKSKRKGRMDDSAAESPAGRQCMDFKVLVLTAGSWPLQAPKSAFEPPLILQDYISKFSTFYHSKHSGRKLQWYYQRSKADVRANCFAQRHDFQVTTYQLAMLLLFNNRDRVLVSEASESMKLAGEEFLVNIFPLVQAKVLTCEPEAFTHRDMKPSTVLHLNKQYRNRRTRVKIPSVASIEAADEVRTTRNEILEDRKMVLQAAAVRIMKTRRSLEHNQLIEEVIRQLQRLFQPSVSQIKQNIEILIEKEYIKRSEDNPQLYTYVA